MVNLRDGIIIVIIITNKGDSRRPEKSRKWESLFSVHVFVPDEQFLSVDYEVDLIA